MKYLYILLILTFFQTAQSQVPGYYGKRFNVQYRPAIGSFVGALLIADRNYDFKEDGASLRYNSLKYKTELYVNLRHDIEINYAVAKNKSLSLLFSIYKTGSVVSSDVFYNGLPGVPVGEVIKLNENIKANHVMFKYKKFTSNIAPIGRYWGFILGYNFGNTSYTDVNDKEYLKEPINAVVFGFESGKHFLLKNNLFVNLGYSLIYTHKLKNKSPDSIDPLVTPSVKIVDRHFLFNALRTHIGIGYMF